jgi:hypothetical protein
MADVSDGQLCVRLVEQANDCGVPDHAFREAAAADERRDRAIAPESAVPI